MENGNIGRPYQVSTAEGGTQPRWRADGKELFYISNGNLMAVEVNTAPKLEFSLPKMLFAAGLDHPGNGTLMRYSVSSDGKRFLINGGTRADEASTAPIHVVLNWMAALKR